MKDISKYIVEKIKERHIIPESKFKLQWKSYLFWVLMIIMIFIGALSLSLVIFNVSDIDPRFLQYMELRKFIMLLMITAPYLWIILFAAALYFGIRAFRSTTKGYRHSTLFITSLVVLSISILGFFSHFLEIDNQMHGMFSKNAPNFKYDIIKEDLIECYLNQHKTTREIAEIYGCSKENIIRQLIICGIPRRKTRKYHVTNEQLRFDYEENKLTIKQISEKYKSTYKQTHKRLKKAKII